MPRSTISKITLTIFMVNNHAYHNGNHVRPHFRIFPWIIARSIMPIDEAIVAEITPLTILSTMIFFVIFDTVEQRCYIIGVAVVVCILLQSTSNRYIGRPIRWFSYTRASRSSCRATVSDVIACKWLDFLHE